MNIWKIEHHFKGILIFWSVIRPVSDAEMACRSTVGFPKLLRMSAQSVFLQPNRSLLQEKLDVLLTRGYVEEKEGFYELTAKGKVMIDNLILFLLDDRERKQALQRLSYQIYR